MDPLIDAKANEANCLLDLQAVRKSAENLRVTLSSIGDAVIATDDKGKVTTINPVAETLTGWPAKDAIGKDLKDIFHIINAKTRKPAENPINKVLERGKTVGLANHTILIARSGSEHQIADSAAPIKDANGHIFGVVLVFRDVTQEYKAAEERFETLARFSGFAEASQYGMGMADLNGRIVYVNPSLAHMLGEQSVNECLGKHFISAYYSPSMSCKLREEIMPALMREGHWHGELELTTVDGRCVPTDENFFIIRDEHGQPRYIADLLTDITVRKRTEEFLRESESRYRGLIDLAVDGILLGDSKGTITNANECMCSMTGLPERALVGKHITQLPFTSQSLQESPLRFDLLQKGEIVVSERVLVRPDGSEVISEMRSKMMPDGTYQSIFRDITARKQTDKFLKLILDNVPDFVFWKDRNSVFLGCNNNIARAAGLSSPDEIIGKTDYDLGWKKEESDFFVATDRRIMESNTAEYHIIAPQLQADGKQAWLDTCKVPLHDEQGNVIGILGTFTDITERKQMEEALRTSNELIDLFMYHSPVYTFIKEVTPTQSRVLQASDNFKQMIGVSGLDIRGKSMEELFPPDFAAKMTRDDWAVVSSKKELKLEETFNGRHYTTIKFPIVQQNKTLLAGYTIDITERKQAEDALRASQVRFKTIIDASPMGMHLYELMNDGHLVFIGANPAADKLLNTDNSQFIGKTIEEAFPKLTQTEVPARYKEVALHGGLWRTEQLEYGEGSIRGAFEVVAFQTEPRQMVAMFNEITDRKRAEKVLREEQKRLRAILNTVGDPIFVKDSDFRFTLANSAFYEMLGLDENAVIGSTLAKDLPADEMRHFFEIDKRVLDTGMPDLREEPLTVKSGRTLSIFTRKARFIDESGKAFVVGAIHDITARKQAEARENELRIKLERGARMESLGVLAGGVAHDLNNILGPIVALPDMAIEYIRRHGDPTDPEHKITLDALQMMKSSALRAAGVVSDLVVMGRRGQFKKEPVNINRVVDQLLESKQIGSMQTSRPEVKLSNQLSGDSLWCLGSESRLARILANLISNAMEAIEGQGNVTIRTNRQLFKTSYQGYELVPPGSYITLEVTDTGCGMDANTITRIFEPFFSTKSANERSGSGLGLSVVHGLVKDHSGYMDVKSAPGKGSTFTVFLPATAEGEETCSEPDILHLPGGTERILVIDDEPGQRFLTQQYLRKMGYSATVVMNGKEALVLMNAAKQSHKPSPFDLVMTDMLMEGMDGLATCKAILNLYPSQKLVLMSGHVPDGYEHQVKALNAEWLNKPFTPFELARAVRLRLDRR